MFYPLLTSFNSRQPPTLALLALAFRDCLRCWRLLLVNLARPLHSGRCHCILDYHPSFLAVSHACRICCFEGEFFCCFQWTIFSVSGRPTRAQSSVESDLVSIVQVYGVECFEAVAAQVRVGFFRIKFLKLLWNFWTNSGSFCLDKFLETFGY